MANIKPTYEELEQRYRQAEVAAQRALREKELILNSTAEMFTWMDVDLRVQWANRASALSVGQTPEQMIGRHCYEIWHNRSAPCENCPIQKARWTGVPQQGEARTPDGRQWFLRGYPVLDEAGQVVSLVEFGQDITERKQTEAALNEANQRFQTVLEHLPGALFAHDMDGRIRMVNAISCACTGYSRDELLRMNVADIDPQSVTRDDRGRLWRALGPGQSTRIESWHRRKDGTQYPAEIHLTAVSLNNEPLLIAMVFDVTARRQAEAALQESQRRLSSLFRAAPVGIGMVHYRVLEEVNEFLCSMLGYAREELIGQSARILYPTEEEFQLVGREKYRQIAESGVGTVETRFRCKDGRVLDVLLSSAPVDPEHPQEHVTFTVLDITERKRAEEALKQSEERFRALVQHAPLSIAMVRQGKYVFFNPAGARLMGYSQPEEIIGRDALSVIAPEFHEAVRARMRRIQAGENNPPLEMQLLTKDGRRVWTLSSSVSLVMDGEPTAIVVGEDITERKEAAADHERLMAAIEQAGEIIVITDAQGAIQYVNPAFEKATGYSRAEVMGRNPRILKSGEHDAAFYATLWQTLTSGRTWSGRLVNRRKDGTIYTEDATISPVRDASGAIVNYVAVKSDITARLQLEEQYRQAQKMEAIGQLTGGVAHDFNNLLQVINGYTDLALQGLDEDHPVRLTLRQVATAGDRAANLVGQLLAFSRRQIMRPQALDLNGVVADLLKMLRRVIGEHIRLEWIPAPRLGAIYADRGMIEQTIMNLCVNARDAMPQGGRLTLETENVRIGSEYCATHAWAKPGRYVLLSVTDTGCGMDKQILDRIFEPFFTTKAPGKGTGLGLSTVYGIIKQHDGMVTAYSEPGKGSTFKVYIPISERDAVDVGTKITGEAPGGRETILIAEDDPMVRRLSQTMLEKAGYTVLVAANGAEAVQRFQECGGKIDLALLDVVMPELGGREAWERMRSIKPDLKALFASGYSENSVHTNFVLDEGVELLPKPYARDTLLRAVRAALDA